VLSQTIYPFAVNKFKMKGDVKFIVITSICKGIKNNIPESIFSVVSDGSIQCDAFNYLVPNLSHALQIVTTSWHSLNID
jgi:hypothetical protein